MRLATLVDLLERDMPGIGQSATTRTNLGRLYAERGHHDDAVAELRSARRDLQQRGDATAIAEVTAQIASSLAGAGRHEQARREARRALADGTGSPAVVARMQRILAAAGQGSAP